MKPLYTTEEFCQAKNLEKLSLECEYCGNTFLKNKCEIVAKINQNNKNGSCKFCSRNCKCLSTIKKQKVNCAQCGKEFRKSQKELQRTKNNFCTRSCAGKYYNSHKTKGTRRSKLEVWLEQQLTALYPTLEIHYNKTDAINSELDIYIPSLKLAFELNGVFHYEPIYGKEKLESIQNNDNRKFQACLERNIELCIIDTSKPKHQKLNHMENFLKIITNLVNKYKTLL